MIFNTENNQRAINDAINYVLKLSGKRIEVKEKKKTRTNDQNSARWLYLTMVAEELNERGETFTPPEFKKMNVPFTKDNLYEIYWQTLRNNMYPNKKGQLNTKEFSDLVEMVLMMFAEVLNISLPFPNMEDYTHKKDADKL